MTEFTDADDFVNSCTAEARKLVNSEEYVEVMFYNKTVSPSRKPKAMKIYKKKNISPMKSDDLEHLRGLILENEKLRAELNAMKESMKDN